MFEAINASLQTDISFDCYQTFSVGSDGQTSKDDENAKMKHEHKAYFNMITFNSKPQNST